MLEDMSLIGALDGRVEPRTTALLRTGPRCTANQPCRQHRMGGTLYPPEPPVLRLVRRLMSKNLGRSQQLWKHPGAGEVYVLPGFCVIRHTAANTHGIGEDGAGVGWPRAIGCWQ